MNFDPDFNNEYKLSPDNTLDKKFHQNNKEFNLFYEKVEKILHKEMNETVWYKKFINKLSRNYFLLLKCSASIFIPLAFAHDVLRWEFLRNSSFYFPFLMICAMIFISVVFFILILKISSVGNSKMKKIPTIGEFLRNRAGLNFDRTSIDMNIQNKQINNILVISESEVNKILKVIEDSKVSLN